MIQNSEIRFKSFVVLFNQVFNIMDRKLKGNFLSKEFEKEKVKNNIITYKKYLNEILDIIGKKYIKSNEKISDKEGKKIVNNIKVNWEKLIKEIEEDFNDYNKELIEIGKEILEYKKILILMII